MKPVKVVFLFLAFSFIQLFAGNSGKIVGLVTDKASGEPLIGVNVIVQGSGLGASTDLNGEYFILNVPPGNHKIECSYVGYQTVVMDNIQVSSDQTTVVNFTISEQTMELDESIVVTAERPLVRKDLTASKNITTTEEIKTLPVETFAGIMLTQAGVTQGAGGELHIRGGRSTEIAYLVDGVSVANPFSTNGIATSVATNSIQEMSVVSGAFNAEYGNAMSGIVNFTTKDGSPDFNTFLSFYSGDYISSHKDIFVNIDDINPFANHNLEGTLSGPLSFLGLDGNSNTFFMSARYNASEGYLYGVREHLTTDSANFERKKYVTIEKDEGSFITTTEYRDEWYIENKGDGKYVPMNPREGINLLGKMKFQLSPSLSMRIQTIFEKNHSKAYVHAYKYNPDGINNYYSQSYNNSLSITHTLSNRTFYEAKLAYNLRDYKSYAFKDINDPRYAPSNKIQGNPGGSTFNFGGAQMGQNFENSTTILGKFDLTSQLNKNNLFKMGLEGRRHRLDKESYYIGYNRNQYMTPTKVYSSSGGAYVEYPVQVSAYAQDKLEYEDMIINAGLRYDYFYSDADYAVDELQPDGQRAHAKPKQMLSPRLGISFPITAQGIIHLSYGHFYQMPALSNLYTNPNFYLPVSGTPVFGNANLEPEKQITYELGLKQQLGGMMVIDVTGFYKDIRNLLAWQTITFTRLEGDRQNYRIRRNQDYANVMGITLSLEKRSNASSPIAAKIDYTFQISEGNDNDPSAFYYNSLSGQENIKKIIPLDWDQTHNLYASITYIPTQALALSMIGRLSTGYPYSPYLLNTNYDFVPNSGRKPTTKNMDIRVSYRVKVANVGMKFFVKVYNLFDTLNERYVFNDTGTASYTFASRDINEPESFKKHYGEPGVHTYDEYNIRPQYYRSPRSVRFGLSLDF